MRKRRFEILLPVRFNDGRPIPEEFFEQTREEVVAQFDAMSFVPQPTTGIWQHEGQRFKDESVKLVVDVEDNADSVCFFTNLKMKLMERFEQLDIYIASYPVDIL